MESALLFFAFYSAPPLRSKERGILGVLIDVLVALGIPFSLLVLLPLLAGYPTLKVMAICMPEESRMDVMYFQLSLGVQTHEDLLHRQVRDRVGGVLELGEMSYLAYPDPEEGATL